MSFLARRMATPTSEALALVGVVATSERLGDLEGFVGAIPHESNVALLVYAGLQASELSGVARRLARCCASRVIEVTDAVRLEAGCVYLLASEDDVSLEGRTLQVQPSTLAPATSFGVERFVQALCEGEPRQPLVVNLAHSFDEAFVGVHAAGGIVLDTDSTDLVCLSDSECLDAPSLARVALQIATLRVPAPNIAGRAGPRAKKLRMDSSEPGAPATERHSGVMPVARDVRANPSSQIVFRSANAEELLARVAQLESDNARMALENAELQEELRTQGDVAANKRQQLELLATKIYAANQQYQSQLADARAILRVYRQAFEGLELGVLFLGKKGELLRHNRAALGAFALQEKHLGRSVDELPCRFEYPLLRADLQRVLNLGEAVEARVVHAAGIWLLRFSPMLGEDSEVAGVVLSCSLLLG